MQSVYSGWRRQAAPTYTGGKRFFISGLASGGRATGLSILPYGFRNCFHYIMTRHHTAWHHRLFPIALLFCVLIWGCRTEKEITRPTLSSKAVVAIDSSLAALYHEVATASPRLSTMTGSADMTIQSPETKQNLGGLIRIARQTEPMMQMTGSVFLGITAFDAMIQPDSVFFYVPVQKNLFVGENRLQNMRRITGVSIGFSEVINAFLGFPQLDTALSHIERVERGAGVAVFFLNAENKMSIVELSESERKVVSLRLLDSLQRTVGAIYFREFESVRLGTAAEKLPKQIEIVSYEYGAGETYTARQVLIRYRERQFNATDFAFDFRPSKKAKRFRIEEMRFEFK
jgi:hypothetical protein